MAKEISYLTIGDIKTLWRSTLKEVRNAIPPVKGTVYINSNTSNGVTTYTRNYYDNTLKYIFQGCSALTTITSNIFKNLRNVSACSGAFQNCTSLIFDVDTTEKLFEGFTQAEDFQYTFKGCSGEISYDVFKDCIKAYTFAGCFYNGNWKSTKQNKGCFYHIFRNTVGYIFSGCFENSTIDYLTEVFTGLTTANNLRYCFSNVKIVYNIEEAIHLSGMSNCDWRDMFRGCPNITDFTSCLYNITIKKNTIKNMLTDEYYQYILDLRDCRHLPLTFGTQRAFRCYFNVDGAKKAFAVIKFDIDDLYPSNIPSSEQDFRSLSLYPSKNAKAESSDVTPSIYAKAGSILYQRLENFASEWGFELKEL